MLIQDFEVVIGDTMPVNATINQNLTGCSIQWFLRNGVDDEGYIYLKSTGGGGITVTDAAQGKFSFELSAAETATLSKTVYYHEAKTTDVAGKVTTVFSGSVTAINGYVMPSYASVEYADMYFDNVLFPEPWTTSDTATKTKALRMATKNIDALVLIGRRVTPDQMQEFPRSIYNAGRGVWVDETTIAQCVKDATCEEALTLMRGGQNAGQRADLQRQGVKSFTLGKLSETYRDNVVAPTGLQSATARTLLQRYTGGSRAIL